LANLQHIGYPTVESSSLTIELNSSWQIFPFDFYRAVSFFFYELLGSSVRLWSLLLCPLRSWLFAQFSGGEWKWAWRSVHFISRMYLADTVSHRYRFICSWALWHLAFGKRFYAAPLRQTKSNLWL